MIQSKSRSFVSISSRVLMSAARLLHVSDQLLCFSQLHSHLTHLTYNHHPTAPKSVRSATETERYEKLLRALPFLSFIFPFCSFPLPFLLLFLSPFLSPYLSIPLSSPSFLLLPLRIKTPEIQLRNLRQHCKLH